MLAYAFTPYFENEVLRKRPYLRMMHSYSGTSTLSDSEVGMTTSRSDMSEWLIHFVHDRNPENDPDWIFGEGESTRFPYVYDDEKNSRFQFWYDSDENYPIEPDAYAIQVIRKIIDDGHIRSTWAFRDGRPTVYGRRAAVCFTEMPLYALVDYAKRRADAANVSAYGTALLKRDAFLIGARPVIYGLTGPHCEIGDDSNQPEDPVKGWPRISAPSCGIAESEQYRYVSFNRGPGRYSDWTHEREWRWCDARDRYPCPGLPLYLGAAPNFSMIVVFVQTSDEAKHVLHSLKAQYDTRYEPSGDELNRDNLLNTRVIALDELPQNRPLRLEDIPMRHLAEMKLPEPSEQLVRKLEPILRDAEAAAQVRANAAYQAAPKNKQGEVLDACGFAWLMISEPQSEITAALLKLHAIRPLGHLGYMFRAFKYTTKSQGLCLDEAAKEELQKHFPKATLWVHTRLD